MIKDFFLALSLEFFFVTLRQLYIMRNILLFSGISKFMFSFCRCLLKLIAKRFFFKQKYLIFITFKGGTSRKLHSCARKHGERKKMSQGKNNSKEKLAKGKLIFFCLSSFCAFFMQEFFIMRPRKSWHFAKKGLVHKWRHRVGGGRKGRTSENFPKLWRWEQEKVNWGLGERVAWEWSVFG